MTATSIGRARGLGRLNQFRREVVAELRKVVWPTRAQLVTYSSVVVVFVTFLATIVSGLDLGFTKLILLVLG